MVKFIELREYILIPSIDFFIEHNLGCCHWSFKFNLSHRAKKLFNITMEILPSNRIDNTPYCVQSPQWGYILRQLRKSRVTNCLRIHCRYKCDNISNSILHRIWSRADDSFAENLFRCLKISMNMSIIDNNLSKYDLADDRILFVGNFVLCCQKYVKFG